MAVRDEFKLHSLAAAKSKRRVHTYQRHHAVVSVRVDPRVWSVALRLAGGDWHRLQVINPDTVVVRNHPIQPTFTITHDTARSTK